MTGLEPAPPTMSRWYSNQLSYMPANREKDSIYAIKMEADELKGIYYHDDTGFMDT